MAYRNLTIAKDNSPVIVNDAMIVSVTPNGSGSAIRLSVTWENTPMLLLVAQPPSVVLSAETVS